MKKFKLNLILLITLVPLLTFCGGELRDALEGKKRSDQSDEFLVKKKNPLQMPPDMNKLPMPCLLYTSPSPRDCLLSRMPSSA